MLTPPPPHDYMPKGMIRDHLQWSAAGVAGSEVRDELARHLGEISRYAGGLILEAVKRGFSVYRKPDGSSYTDADVEAERFILEALAAHFPNIPVIAEEQSAARAEAGESAAPVSDIFFLVDPLDGTRDFTSGGLEYTVNIAAIVNGAPVAGAVYAPANDLLWIGGAHAYTTTIAPYAAPPEFEDWRAIHTRIAPQEGLTALGSRRHGDGRTQEFLARLPIRKRLSTSSSVKFCVIAQGEADVYPRFGPTMEWDTAAGDAVLRAAGGSVVDEKGFSLVYGQSRNGYVNGPFIAWGDSAQSHMYCG
ncbi:3'(2'),5'-bisphosphate nucleotidase CysQ family protein [Pseudochelatococcus sp. G4_1912]|uniref:3'(2'),5'-bisphosphate nucleotidase CysQ family protein n=1 Tax=Pseudochelatococcus sp. G4_1912 TaxID=3114288 RepID=UPI0039C5D420